MTLIMKRVTAIFLQGLVAILPLMVTVVVLSWLGLNAERNLGMAIKLVLPEAWYVTGMGIVAGIVLVFVLGLMVNIWGVPQLIRLGEKVVDRIPLVKTIYGAVRDLLGFFGKSNGLGAVNSVVMVSLSETGIRAVGLLTRERFDDLPHGLGDEESVCVYLPFGYQIGGLTLIVPRACVQPLNMRLEDAMRFIVTAGAKAASAVSPPPSSAVASES